MRRLAPLTLCLLTLWAAVPALAESTVSLVLDVNSAPPSRDGLVAGDLVGLGGRIVFPGHEPSSSLEPWASDGTPAGTAILRDVCPGNCASFPEVLGRVRGIAVLFVDREDSGEKTEVWRTDGTPEGTFALTEKEEGGPESCPRNAAPGTAGGKVFFAARTPASGCELWRSDGTAAGTSRVRDLVPGSEGGEPDQLTPVAGTLFFVATGPGGGTGLWRTDGSGSGTVLLREFDGDRFQGPDLLTASGARLFFLAPGNNGRELWVSNGAAGGTRPVSRFVNPEPFADTRFLKPLDGGVYFVANDGVHADELWGSDGTFAGTRRITDFLNVMPFADAFLGAEQIVKVNGRLLFPANHNGLGYGLWTSGGTPATTQPLSGCPGGCPVIFGKTPMVALGGRVLFPGTTAERGTELWSTDGTGAGTRIVRDLCPGACGSGPRSIAPLSGKAFFVASDDGVTYTLWRTDGTARGTAPVASLGRQDSGFGERFQPVHLPNGEQRFFFRADAGGYTNQLWVSDGTGKGTGLVTVIGSGPGSLPYGFTPIGEDVIFRACDGERARIYRSGGPGDTVALEAASYFCATPPGVSTFTAAGGLAYFRQGEDGSSNQRLWRTDGSEAGTFPLTPAGAGSAGTPAAFGGKVVFPVESSGDFFLWETDGTEEGTHELFQFPQGPHTVRFLTAVGSRLYFLANDTQGEQLWTSDGTEAGTRQLTENLPFSLPLQLVEVGETVFFLAAHLWKTDGTPEGTSVALPGRLPFGLAEFGGALYFFDDTEGGRLGLWRTDGTEAGTVLLKALGAPNALPEPVQFAALGSQLFFAADDGEHGAELWRTDGTAAGTVLVRDIAPGADSSRPFSLTAAQGRLYFTASDGEHGFELWESDGTEAGTRMVQDLAPGAFSGRPEELTAAGGRIFFRADDGLTGAEPWVYEPAAAGPACQPSETVLCLNGGRFRAEVTWRAFEGPDGKGQAVALTPDTGYFWFFNPANVEVVVKVIDGRGDNGHFWVFYGALSNVEYVLTVTDTATGAARRYINPPGRLASVADNLAFGPRGAHGSGLTLGPAATVAPPPIVKTAKKAAEPCVPGPERLCLNGGRFAVEARWRDFVGNTGNGQAVPLSGDTGYFFFFHPNNVEVVAKVLDGRLVNGKYWFFYGALSNVEYELIVTDTETGERKTYENPLGRLASVADTGAF